MPSALDKLNKILALESSQGYRNKAVIGGLENFAPIWQAEARAELSPEKQGDAAQMDAEQIDAIAARLTQYADGDERQRVQIIGEVVDRLKQIGASLRVEGPASHQNRPERPAAPASTPPLPQPTTGHAAAPSTRSEPRARSAAGLDAPVESLPGISAGYGTRLRKLGIATVGDLLHHFPHRYDDYRTLKPINRLEYGEETTIIGTIWDTKTRPSRGGAAIVTSIIADTSGTIEAVWFNQPYLARQLKAGTQVVLSGKIEEHLGRLILRAPVWEPLEKELIHTARLVPIYPLTQGITARWLRRLVKRVLDYWAPRLPDYLPESVRQRAGLMDLSTAIQQIHFPDSQEQAAEARRRLAFDEFLMIQLGMLRQRQEWRSEPGIALPRSPALVDAFLASLPYELTGAQRKSLDQILDDLAGDRPMSRLLQGDVGSGKTVVAAAAMLMSIADGKQAAMMAPTEILAEQHARSLAQLFGAPGQPPAAPDEPGSGEPASGETDPGPHPEDLADDLAEVGQAAPAQETPQPLNSSQGRSQSAESFLGRPVSIALLTGSLNRAERQQVYTAIASGEADIVVGTHALIQQQLAFHDLALVIVDEQHRFGVEQRATLRGKGAAPHMLVMSATPIPRSLALTVYGDLDISTINELPPGRQPIHTRWLLPRERERAYAFIRSQVETGRQAFILYPLIEESEKIDARAAVDECERLQQTIFRTERLGLLHGKMKAHDKDEVMTRFRNHELDILVSTSVIEVGIDVPNATIMLVEGADRFGLAQLHQFRGRVGRGEHKSYCLLLSDSTSPDDPQTRATWERLKAIEETQDGFALAERDLELRGPGDFLGVRQSGLPELRLANLGNVQILEQARTEAQALFESDPTLSKPEHEMLAEKLAQFWKARGELS